MQVVLSCETIYIYICCSNKQNRHTSVVFVFSTHSEGLFKMNATTQKKILMYVKRTWIITSIHTFNNFLSSKYTYNILFLTHRQSIIIITNARVSQNEFSSYNQTAKKNGRNNNRIRRIGNHYIIQNIFIMMITVTIYFIS